ncbi:MAG: hypothetical protein CVU05_04490 [Bacteroidetes bacterium HGW-Bacteroidetes-21]|jgi:hypothetical protein|nr:MAG: hypothetical protein CVU05_04490 [Bacteroidetes bacterium HGW-Bacteroidetes-21]
MKIALFILSLLLTSVFVKAQSETIFDRLSSNEGGSGKITIHQNGNVASLVSKHTELNKKVKGFPGFRIQIYFGNGNKAKEEALRVRNSFNEKYNDIESYILYQSPYFKVRVGDFTNRYDAYIAFQKISLDFPTAFLVEELVNPLK